MKGALYENDEVHKNMKGIVGQANETLVDCIFFLIIFNKGVKGFS